MWDWHDQEICWCDYLCETSWNPPRLRTVTPRIRTPYQSALSVLIVGYGLWLLLWLWLWIVHWSYKVATKSSTFAIAHFLLRKFDIYLNFIPKTFLNFQPFFLVFFLTVSFLHLVYNEQDSRSTHEVTLEGWKRRSKTLKQACYQTYGSVKFWKHNCSFLPNCNFSILVLRMISHKDFTKTNWWCWSLSMWKPFSCSFLTRKKVHCWIASG